MAEKDARRHEIEEALERVRRGDTSPGSSPEQLRAMADEERRRLGLDDRRRL